MTIPDGPQWVQLYRGLIARPETLDKGNLGKHWSTNDRVALSFATDWGSDDLGSSMVIGALVHPRHIMQEGTEEWDNENGDYESTAAEAEKTIRKNVPMHITSITHYPNDTDEEVTWRDQMSFHELRKYRS